MANISKLDYSTINRPYDNNLRRGGEALTPSSAQMINGPAQISPKAIQGATLEDLWINTWFKSTNYKPKKQGFLIDGMNGYIEAMNLYISGSIVGGSLHIPDKTTTNSFHVSTIGDMWIGANVVNKANAPFKVSEAGVITSISGTIGGWTLGATTLSATNAGNTTTLSSGATSFSSGPTGSPTTTITQAGILTCAGAVIDGTSTIGGRDGSDLATAINSSSNLVTDIINARLNTSSKYILSDFDFGSTDYAGAVKAGDIAWNTTTGAITSGSGIAIYRKGIVGANAGATTFSIDATTGSAYFAGEIVADTGIIGGFTITAGYLTSEVEGGGYADKIELKASGPAHIKAIEDANNYVQLTAAEDTPRLDVYYGGYLTASLRNYYLYQRYPSADSGNMQLSVYSFDTGLTQGRWAIWDKNATYAQAAIILSDEGSTVEGAGKIKLVADVRLATSSSGVLTERAGFAIDASNNLEIISWDGHIEIAPAVTSGTKVVFIVGDVAPSIATTYNLGTTTYKWNILFLSQLGSGYPTTEGAIFTKTDHHIYYYNGTDAIQLDGAGVGVYLPLSGGTMAGNINMGTNSITNANTATFSQPILVGTPTQAGHAATRDYVDDFLPLAGGTMAGVINMNSQSISNVKYIYDTSANIAFDMSYSSTIIESWKHISPHSSGAYDLGATTNKWRIIYLSQLSAGYPTTEGAIFTKSDHHIYYYNGSAEIALDSSGGMTELKDDTTPQLGGNLDMNGKTIGGNTEAQLDDAVAKKHTQGNDTSLGSQSQNLNMNSHQVTGLPVPVGDNDAVRKKYLVDNYMPFAGGRFTASVDCNNETCNLGATSHRWASIHGKYLRGDQLCNDNGNAYITMTTSSKIIHEYPVRIYTSGSYPSSPATGEVFYHTSVGALMVYNGAAWETVTSAV